MSSTPNQDGPNHAPPPVPEGWIAQWDGQGRRYFYVQLTTRISQWEVPTQPAPGILTPGQTPVNTEEYPYGKPEHQRQGEVIMNPDGSQSMRYPDGTVYPHNGGNNGATGGDGERGLGVSFHIFCSNRKEEKSYLANTVYLVICYATTPQQRKKQVWF